MRDYLTPAEVAELLRIPEETLRYWRAYNAKASDAKRKGPKSFTLENRRVLYARSDVEAYIADRRQPA
jgi:DNA-binding transcriptional MerR regulator